MSMDQVTPAGKLTPREFLKRQGLRCLFSSAYRGCDCLKKQWKRPRRWNVHKPLLRNSMFNACPLRNESVGIWLKRMKLRKKRATFSSCGENLHTHDLFPFQHLHLQVKRTNEVLRYTDRCKYQCHVPVRNSPWDPTLLSCHFEMLYFYQGRWNLRGGKLAESLSR